MKNISLIIPTYNSCSSIKKTIRSITSQNLSLIKEVILVDDFSTDNTVDFLIKYSRKNPLFSVYKNKVKGANYARQLGVKYATGKYVIFMDSDDTLTLNGIETLYNLIEYNNVGLVCGNILRIDNDTSKCLFDFSDEILFKNDERNLFTIVPPSPCAKIFKRDILNSFEFLNIPFAQDWNITYKYLMHIESVFFTNEIVYNYITRDGSTSCRKKYITLDQLITVTGSFSDLQIYANSISLPKREKANLMKLKNIFFINMFDRIKNIESKEDAKSAYLAIRKQFFSNYEKMPNPLISKKNLALSMILINHLFLRLYFKT